MPHEAPVVLALCPRESLVEEALLIHAPLMCPVLIVATQGEDKAAGNASAVKTRAQVEKHKQKKLNIDEAEGKKKKIPLSLSWIIYLSFSLLFKRYLFLAISYANSLGSNTGWRS